MSNTTISGRLFGGDFQGAAAIAGNGNAVTFQLQQLLQAVAHIAIVVDQQDASRHSGAAIETVAAWRGSASRYNERQADDEFGALLFFLVTAGLHCAAVQFSKPPHQRKAEAHPADLILT